MIPNVLYHHHFKIAHTCARALMPEDSLGYHLRNIPTSFKTGLLLGLKLTSYAGMADQEALEIPDCTPRTEVTGTHLVFYTGAENGARVFRLMFPRLY